MPQGLALLVDDDPRVRGVLTLLLESEGWQVAEADDGSAALTLARRLEPGLVVTDLRMPGMSGIALARALSACPSLHDVALVAITADASGLRDAAERSGLFATVLVKPLAPTGFLDVVRKLVREDPGAETPT